MASPDERPLVIPVAAGVRLEGRFQAPPGPARGAALVLHPHPLYGGSMHNNVVEALCAGVRAAGWASLRFNFRSEDFQLERKQTGHPRGYVSFGGRIEWTCRPPQRTPANGLGNFQESMPEWKTVTDYRGWDMAQPYLAPDGAVSATVIFGMTTLAEGRRPKLFLDDVAFVDVTKDAD